MERTTDLEKVRKGAPFTWGRVREIHTIGRYDIVEYQDKAHPNEVVFHIYVDGKSTSTGETTLERALVMALAKAHNEINTDRHMAEAAYRILSLKEPK